MTSPQMVPNQRIPLRQIADAENARRPLSIQANSCRCKRSERAKTRVARQRRQHPAVHHSNKLCPYWNGRTSWRAGPVVAATSLSPSVGTSNVNDKQPPASANVPVSRSPCPSHASDNGAIVISSPMMSPADVDFVTASCIRCRLATLPGVHGAAIDYVRKAGQPLQ